MATGQWINVDVDPADARIALCDEAPGDVAAIRELLRQAFPGPAESRLVDALRGAAAIVVSRVARAGGVLVGHVLLSPVTIEQDAGGAAVLGLAPLAVLPEHQRRGVGASLMRDALERALAGGAGAVVLLGEPAYYRRFGFRPAREFGLHCQWPGTEEAFMAIELLPGTLSRRPGLVRYHGAFDSLE